MEVKHHISGAIMYDGIRVCCRVIEESKCLFIRFLGGFGLLGSDGFEVNENCQVEGNAVMQQGSEIFLDQGDGFGGEQRGDVFGGTILYIGAIFWTIPQVQRVLGALRYGVLEFMKGLF